MPSDHPSHDANVMHRKEQIAKSLERLYQLDREIADIVAGEIKGLREDKAEIRKQLKEDFNMPGKLVNARYAAYKLERLAEDTKDEVTLDAIREMFSYVPVGGQGSLMPGLEPKPEKLSPKAKLPTIEECETLGAISFRTGVAEDGFPETVTTKARKEAWLSGWHKAKIEAEEEERQAWTKEQETEGHVADALREQAEDEPQDAA